MLESLAKPLQHIIAGILGNEARGGQYCNAVSSGNLFEASVGYQILAFFRVATGVCNQAAQTGVAIVVARQQH